MKQRLISLVLVFAMVVSLFPATVFATGEGKRETTPATSESLYTDVNEGDWFYEAVRYVSANGIFNGTGDNAFAPNGTMNRAMFVTVLGRLAGIDPADYAGPTGMADVPEDAWYAPYVKWAMQFGITLGTGDGKFSPDAEIDRAQMAVFFVRYFETFDVSYETGAEVTTTPADLDSVPDYAKDAVLKLWRQGLLNGDGVSFAPAEKASRAQVATLSQRVDESVETWYSEPGVPSERVPVDPDAQQPEEEQKPQENKKPGSGTSRVDYQSVKFELGAGQDDITLPETQSVAKGTAINTLPTPCKSGVIFLGWYYDKALTRPVETGDTVNQNMTLYAKVAQGEAVQAIETPNYITKNDIDAAVPFVFGVTGTSEKNDIKITNVTGGNLAVEFDFDGSTVTATLEAGQTYQVELLNDAARFVIDNETQGEAIRYLNILTAKTEVTNAALNESVGKVEFSDISGLNEEAFNGLFKMDETNTVAENTTTGTFTYSGNLNIGDTVAITSGNVDLNDPTSTDGDVAYLKITGKNGNTYTYEMADVDDVLFIPDVLPIESTWDQVADDGNKLTISSGNLATAMSNVEAEALNEGDFLGFISGTYSDESTTVTSYGKVESYTIDGNNYVISYEAYETTEAGEAAIASALDVYYAQDQQVTLSASDIEKIENDIKSDVVESGYAPQAAAYLAAVFMESDDLTTVPDMDLVTQSMGEIDTYGLSKGRAVQTREGKSVEVDFDTRNINVKLGTHSKLDHLQGRGFNVEIDIPFTVTINDTIEIAIKASFEEEIILSQKISTKRHKTGFLKYDYSLNASFEVGNYTGIGFTADITTTDGGENESMLAKLEDIMDRMEDYHESGGVSTTGGTMEGLAEIYQGVMENANDAWIDIVEVKLFENNGNAFLHIFCWQIKGTFVVSANLAVSLGMSFEYITQKQYNFSIRVKDRTSTNETIDIITPQYNFDFYVVGTIGIRAGIRLEMYVGLFSLKLDKIGITAEAGAYARLWGYFFYHLHWEQGQGKTENSAGAMFIEIGMYLDINFLAQLLSSSKLTWNPTIYSNEWPLWSAGEQQNVYGFAYDGTDYDLKVTRKFPLPASTFEMKYMDLKSGETGTVNKDSDKEGTDEEFFTVSFSNSENFSYDAATNTVTVGSNADGLGEETDMTITWKKASLAFSSMPIQKVIHITWSDPASVHCITFDSTGGTEVAPIMATPGTSINWPANPKKTGYTFTGWREMHDNDYSATVMPDLNPTRNIRLHATWEPNENTPYKVEHYQETPKGTYELAQVETKYGTTDGKTQELGNTYTNYIRPDYETIEQQTIAADGSTVVEIYYDRDTFNVSWESDGATLSDETSYTKGTTRYGTQIKAPKTPTKSETGYTYTFDGWYTKAEDGTMTKVESFGKVTEDVTYYARFTKTVNKYNLTWRPDAICTMSGNYTEGSVAYGTPIVAPTMSREGYKFDGWDKEIPATMPANDLEFTAKWKINEYTLTLVDASGTLNEKDASKTVTYGYNYNVLPSLSRTGYTFDGWFTEETGGTEIESAHVNITGDLTLYAHWTVKTYRIIYRFADGLTADHPTTYTYGIGATLPAVSKTGYDFKGWYKNEGFSGDPVTSIADTETGNVELYAKWTAKTHTVTFDANGGTLPAGTTNPITVTYGSTYGDLPELTEYPGDETARFQGWFTAATGGTQVKSTTKVTGEVNETLYAQWKFGAVEYTHISINGKSIFAYPDTGKVDGYEDGSVKFDATNNILTLTNATITGTGLQFLAYNGKNPSIKLIGNNTVTCDEYDETSSGAYAIYIDLVNGNGDYATFDGDGTLTVSVDKTAIGANTTSVAAIYGRTKQSSSNGKYYGYMYINNAIVEATVPDVSEGVTAVGVMLGDGSEGSYLYSVFGKLTAKGGTSAVCVYTVQDNANPSYPSVKVSANYSGLPLKTVEGDRTGVHDLSTYKYFTFPASNS